MAVRKKFLDLSTMTRKRSTEIEDFLNRQIQNDKNGIWKSVKSNNYGLVFQRAIADYFESKKEKFGIALVECNLNPSDPKPDIVCTMKDGSIQVYEVKSFKDTMLSGLTICNHPSMLKSTITYLINYIFAGDKVAVRSVVETELHRLTGLAKPGTRYAGCILATRDNGKKAKGRSFNDFYFSDPANDTPLDVLLAKEMLLKTELHYTVSKLVPGEYETQEVADAYEYQRDYTRPEPKPKVSKRTKVKSLAIILADAEVAPETPVANAHSN